MSSTIQGNSCDEVKYCPKCSNRIEAQDSEGKCHCNFCEFEFYVLEA